MPIQDGRYISPTWLNNGPPAIDQTELQAMTDTLEQLDSGTGGSGGKRYATFVIGTATNGWTTADCDYLCDGISDDVEFNAAISDIPSSGGEIVVLSGTYILSEPLEILNGVSMIGSGQVQIKRQTPNGASSINYMVYIKSGTLSNLAFDGNKSIFQGSPQNVYEVVAGPSCVIRNCSFSNFVYGAVYSEGTNVYPPSTIKGNFFDGISSNTGVGVYIGDTDATSIYQNTFWGMSTNIQSGPVSSSQNVKCLFIKDNYSGTPPTGDIILDGISQSIVSGNSCNSIQILNTSAKTGAGQSNIISQNILNGEASGSAIILGSNTSYNFVTGNNLSWNGSIGSIEDNGTNNSVNTTGQITLSSSGWSGNTQTVSAMGVTQTNTVTTGPAPSSMNAAMQAGVYCSAQGQGTLTFTCSSVPSSSLTYNYVTQGVN